MSKDKNKDLSKFLLNEEDDFDVKDVGYSEDEKRYFVQRLQSLKELETKIIRTPGLKDAIKEVQEMVNYAQEFIKDDTADWFDDLTVKRHIKYLNEAEKAFNKAATENVQTQMRLEAAYEDIISILKRYYDI